MYMKTNEELQKDVMEELKWNPLLRDVYTQIGVSAKDGVITLSGLVDTYSKKLTAERTAQHVPSVRVVACDVEVKIAEFGKKTDSEIAEAVKNALRRNSAVDEDKIELKVDNGWVFMDGSVDWEYQKISAQNSVENLLGLRGLTNNVTIRSKDIDVKDIKNKIMKAFQRNTNIDACGIKLESSGCRVTLSGTVRSWIEKEETEKIAWSSPGVLSVDNRIEIGV